MNTFIDDLKKMDTLSGKELELFLTEMKARYTSPEEKEAIRLHLLGELVEIKADIANIEMWLKPKEREQLTNRQLKLTANEPVIA